MTEPSSAEAEAPIEDGDLLSEVKPTDFSGAPLFEDDKLEAFNSRDHQGWPDHRPGPEGGNFEDEAFPPQPDGGVS